MVLWQNHGGKTYICGVQLFVALPPLNKGFLSKEGWPGRVGYRASGREAGCSRSDEFCYAKLWDRVDADQDRMEMRAPSRCVEKFEKPGFVLAVQIDRWEIIHPKQRH